MSEKMTMMSNMTKDFLNASNIAWFVFIDLFQPNYLKKLLKNVKNSQNDLSEKNDSDDKYDNFFFNDSDIASFTLVDHFLLN